MMRREAFPKGIPGWYTQSVNPGGIPRVLTRVVYLLGYTRVVYLLGYTRVNLSMVLTRVLISQWC